jgi:hypothetical protein
MRSPISTAVGARATAVATTAQAAVPGQRQTEPAVPEVRAGAARSRMANPR